MKKEHKIILILVGIIVALIISYSVSPRIKYSIQQEAVNNLALTQSTQQILFYPVKTQDNQTILNYITWQELCQNLGGIK